MGPRGKNPGDGPDAERDGLRGVTIEQLRTLGAVVTAGSFSDAARRLGRVQGAVSQSIERLEAQLGLRLFDRSSRVPRLTRHGTAIAAAAARIEAEVHALEELTARLQQGEETSLAIVVDAMFPTASLARFAQDFAREHPSVELVLFTELLSAVTAHVREKRSAWGIALEDADLADLDHRPVADVRLIPVAAPDHPLARHGSAPLAAAQLTGAVQIVLGEQRADGLRSPDAHGVFSPRTWRVVDLATKHALIASGLGWGHMPEHLVRDDLRAGKLVELHLETWGGVAPRRSLVLVWRRGSVMGPVALWSQEHLGRLCRSVVDPASAHHDG